MSALAQLIRREIESQGPITVARFMELALYHPGLGYYEQQEPQTGRAGDFYTNVSVGPVFGELLAFRMSQLLSTLGTAGSTPLHWVEAGAHDGRLAADILAFLNARESALAARLVYWLLEPSSRRRDQQAERLRAFGSQVCWARDWSELPPVCGVIFSNELLDAMPVHRLVWDAPGQVWREIGVGVTGDQLALMTLPGEATALAPDMPPELRRVLPDGYTVEVTPAACAWWRRAAQALARGWLLTVDYGDAPGERHLPERTGGTLRAFRRHQATRDVLAEPGRRDLTAHVDFGAIQAAGESSGLRTVLFVSQERFLGSVLRDVEAVPGRFPPWTAPRLRQCRTLLHPGQLGASFRVLVQEREPAGGESRADA